MTKSLFSRFALSRTLAFVLVSGLGVVGPAPAGAAGKPKAPKLTGLRCVPAAAAVCAPGVRVAVGEFVALRGKRLARNQRVTFTWSKGHTTGKTTKQRGVAGYVVRVPSRTPTGAIQVTVKDRHGRRSNRIKLKVVSAPAAPPTTVPTPGADTPAPGSTASVATGGNPVPAAFTGAGLWIWRLNEADGGAAATIVSRARSARINTIILKSADGVDSEGSQFSAALVNALHAADLRVCAWQFIYGGAPAAEAAKALESVTAGADCLVLNAEKQYNGRYAQAQQYMSALRAGAGADFPIGFSSYARPTAYPNLPFSVFLGPGGAQVNLTQVYWQEGGRPVAKESADAAAGNRIYGRPLAPIGQSTGAVTFDDLQSFRSIWQAYGATGVSWFRWDSALTPADVWNALALPTPTLDPPVEPGWQAFAKGSSGDGVRWAQQHLAAFDPSIDPDGTFGDATEAVLRRFQLSRGLPSTGGTGPRTWAELLKLTPVAIDWSKRAQPASR